MLSRSACAAPWLFLFASGCLINDGGDSIDDDDVYWPQVRASIDLDHRGPVPVDTGPADTGTRGNLTIDIEVTGAEGETTEHLSAGDRFLFGDLVIDGPADLDVEYGLALASAAMGASLFFRNGFALTGTLGLAYTQLELDVDSGVLSIDDTVWGLGPLIGGKVAWYPGQALGFYALASNRTSFPDEFDWVAVDQLELGIELVPWPSLAFFAGYRWLSYEGNFDHHSHHHDHDSELDFEFEGPMAGLAVTF